MSHNEQNQAKETGHQGSHFNTGDVFYSKRIENSVLPESPNESVCPDITLGNAYVKVPVVLGETKVFVNLDTIIKFPEPVLEIKEIKKSLKLTQCRLLLPTNQLFLKGFVRKNIQYATPRSGNKNSVLSTIRSLTVDIPFNTVTSVDFLNRPNFHPNPDTREFTFFTASELPKGFSQKEKLLSGDFSQYDQISGQVLNELPYCELLDSKFIEYDEALDREMGKVYNYYGEEIEAPFEEGTFTKIEEKMVVELTIKVLQNQQLNVNSKKRR